MDPSFDGFFLEESALFGEENLGSQQRTRLSDEEALVEKTKGLLKFL
jgi:hypothetical protein